MFFEHLEKLFDVFFYIDYHYKLNDHLSATLCSTNVFTRIRFLKGIVVVVSYCDGNFDGYFFYTLRKLLGLGYNKAMTQCIIIAYVSWLCYLSDDMSVLGIFI